MECGYIAAASVERIEEGLECQSLLLPGLHLVASWLSYKEVLTVHACVQLREWNPEWDLYGPLEASIGLRL